MAWNFENKKFEGIHYSRIIASWANKGVRNDELFKEWLGTITINDKSIPPEVIDEIYDMATCGKLELETSVIRFRTNRIKQLMDEEREWKKKHERKNEES